MCALLVPLTGGAGNDAKRLVRGVDNYAFTYRVILPEIKGEGRLWIPLARRDRFQVVTLTKRDVPARAREVTDRVHGNRVLVADVGPTNSGQVVTIEYRVSRREKPIHRARKKPRTYLKPQRLVPEDERFDVIAQEVVAGLDDRIAQCRALYDHVLGRMKYDKSGTGWGRGDAIYACDAKAGNCTDFHSYIIALARTVGIPARFAIGATIPPDRDTGAIGGYHCWAELWANGQWIPMDVSEASKHPELKDYYFGHHPANRIEFSVGRDLKLRPAPESGPPNYLIYPLLEIDGEPTDTKIAFSFKRIGAGE